jgi:hypothetical protein
MWGLRLNFALILGVFSGLLFWQGEHTLLEWAFFGVGVVAIAALSLDFIVRWRVQDLAGLLILSGLCGMLLSLNHHTLGNDFPITVVLYGTGISTLAFFSAYIVFNWLAVVYKPTHAIYFALIGLIGAVWTYRIPADIVELGWTKPSLFPLIAGVLVLAAIGVLLPIALPRREVMESTQWLLKPGEWLPVLAVCLVIPLVWVTQDKLTPLQLGVGIGVSFMLGVMLWAYRLMKKPDSYLKITFIQPNPFLLLWIIGLGLGYGVGYILPVLFGRIILGGIFLFGAFWLPIVSSILGYEGYFFATSD